MSAPSVQPLAYRVSYPRVLVQSEEAFHRIRAFIRIGGAFGVRASIRRSPVFSRVGGHDLLTFPRVHRYAVVKSSLVTGG